MIATVEALTRPLRRYAGPALILAFCSRAVYAGPCDEPPNKVVCENSKAGNPPSDWDISGTGDPSIQGYATEISVNRGETVFFKIDTDAAKYRLDIYRMGYYGGLGARKVATISPSASLPQKQPACIKDAATGLTDCGNWAVSASWNVPADTVSGIYFAKAVRTDTGGAGHIVFIVRDDSSSSDLLFQTSDTTWQAYNSYGGNFIEYPSYGYPTDRAFKGSYNRPFWTRRSNDGLASYNWVFHAEYPMVRWLEANGYDVSYFTGMDCDRRGNLIQNHKVFLSVGHDEYWSRQQRANVEAARNAGVHLAFFSGNEIYRKIRWENSIDGSGTPYRTMVCYKESNAEQKIDPLPDVWTGCWRDARFSPPADGGLPENALTGTLFTICTVAPDSSIWTRISNRVHRLFGGVAAASNLGISLSVPAANGKMRFWRGTPVATLAAGQTAKLGDRVVGYECDEDFDNGFRPAGLIQLSSTPLRASARLVDDNIHRGQDSYPPGPAAHVMTIYRAASGALVFSAGTVQWSWGLDGQHDNGASTSNTSMRQATVNLLTDMGVQPGTLQSGLVPANASTNHTPPTSTITQPTDGSSLPLGTAITISGIAADTLGVVAAVEVSADGGQTWHPASGRTTWSYTWTPTMPGSFTLVSRAVDDSGNLEMPSAGIDVTLG